MFTHENQRGKVIHKRPEQGMTAKERTQRLNAAFDELADGLTEDELAEMTAAMTGVKTIDEVRQQRNAIRALARRNSVREIYAFEMCAGDLRRDGDLCFLVRWESKDAWRHHIRLYKDLSALLGLRPHLFDYKAFDQAARESILEKAISL